MIVLVTSLSEYKKQLLVPNKLKVILPMTCENDFDHFYELFTFVHVQLRKMALFIVIDPEILSKDFDEYNPDEIIYFYFNDYLRVEGVPYEQEQFIIMIILVTKAGSKGRKYFKFHEKS